MPEVIVLNVHGGYPSSMVDRSLCELSGFRQLAKISATYDRAYPTNACAGSALHDIIMDAPIGTMPDAVWHSWAFVQHATRTMFHVFKQNSYDTRLIGAFGLNRSLEPGIHMHTLSDELRTALRTYGIDECDPQDASFTCQVAFAHDDEALERLVSHIDTDADTSRLTVVNLLGCQDAQRCAFAELDPQSRGSVPLDDDDYDERRFSESVLEDDARSALAPSHQIDALRRAVMTLDWIRGHATPPSREQTVRSISAMHELCWKCLCRLDDALQKVLAVLAARNRLEDAIIYLFSDHAMSLYEHGQICEAPWESCLRTLWIRKAPHATARRISAPTSLAELVPALFADTNISPVPPWRDPPNTKGCITLGLASSWLGRASMPPVVSPLELRTFFLRAVLVYRDQRYAFTFWFSLGDLMSFPANPDCEWPNPVLRHTLSMFSKNKALQVYNHATDPHETNNLGQDATWIHGDTATELKLRIDAVVRGFGLERLRLRIPSNPEMIGVDKIDLCAVQLHHRVVRKLAPPVAALADVADAATQTESSPSLLAALKTAFGNLSAEPRLPPTTSKYPITIFVPYDTYANDATWPTWAPPPLRGAYTRDTMQRVATHGLLVTDALRGETHTLHTFDDNHVVFGQCRILLQTAINIIHSRGYVIAYSVCPQKGLRSPSSKRPQIPVNPTVENVKTTPESDAKIPSLEQTHIETSLEQQTERIISIAQSAQSASRTSNVGKLRKPRVVRNPGASSRPQQATPRTSTSSVRALESQSHILKQHM